MPGPRRSSRGRARQRLRIEAKPSRFLVTAVFFGNRALVVQLMCMAQRQVWL